MASVAELRGARKRMQALPAKKVTVNTAGAYIANLSLAVQERVSSLSGAEQFIERHIFDDNGRPVPKTTLFTNADSSNLGVLSGCPPPEMTDVHLT